MEKLIALFILFFSLTLFQSESFSRPVTKQMVDTDKEVNKINRITYERLELYYQVGLTHKKIVLFRDKGKKIRKIDYTSYQNWYYLSTRHYFSKDEKTIFLICNSPARIYFSNAKPVGKSGQKQANDTVWFRSVQEFRKRTLEELRLGKDFEEDHGIRYLYKMNYEKLNGKQFEGTYHFSRPKRSNQTIINKSTMLYNRANVESRVIQKLRIFDRVKILSIREKQKIGRWGKHSWYQIKTIGGTKGWVFGAFLEPVEAKIK